MRTIENKLRRSHEPIQGKGLTNSRQNFVFQTTIQKHQNKMLLPGGNFDHDVRVEDVLGEEDPEDIVEQKP